MPLPADQKLGAGSKRLGLGGCLSPDRSLGQSGPVEHKLRKVGVERATFSNDGQKPVNIGVLRAHLSLSARRGCRLAGRGCRLPWLVATAEKETSNQHGARPSGTTEAELRETSETITALQTRLAHAELTLNECKAELEAERAKPAAEAEQVAKAAPVVRRRIRTAQTARRAATEVRSGDRAAARDVVGERVKVGPDR